MVDRNEGSIRVDTTTTTGVQHVGSPQSPHERLYMHHTVASLAQRIDFDVSMLDQKNHFVSPTSNRRRRHSFDTAPTTTTPSRSSVKTADPRTRSSSLTRISTKSTSLSSSSMTQQPLRKSTETPRSRNVQEPQSSASISSSAPSSASPDNKNNNNNSKTTKRSPKKKPNYGGSLSLMFAANQRSGSGATDKSASSAVMSVDSKASTVLVENTSNPQPRTTLAADSRSVSSNNNNNNQTTTPAAAAGEDLLLGANAEEDLLNTLLDSSAGDLAEPGAFGMNEEDELVFDNNDNSQSDGEDDNGPGIDLEEQEAAMAQALERAVEEFETAAGAASNVSLFDQDETDGVGGGAGELLDDDGVGQLLAAAAKTVATVDETLEAKSDEEETEILLSES